MSEPEPEVKLTLKEVDHLKPHVGIINEALIAYSSKLADAHRGMGETLRMRLYDEQDRVHEALRYLAERYPREDDDE